MSSARIAILSMMALCVLAFGLPFASVTYSGTPLATVDGWQLVTGARVITESASPGSEPLAVAAQPLAGVALLLLLTTVSAAAKRPASAHIQVGTLAAAGAAICLLLFGAQLPTDAQPSSPGLFTLWSETGLWIASVLAVAQTGIILLLLRNAAFEVPSTKAHQWQSMIASRRDSR